MFEKNFPLKIDYLDTILEKTLFGRNVTCLFLPKMYKSEFAAKLQDKNFIDDLTKKKYTQKLSEVEFILLNLSLNREFFLLQLNEELSNFSKKSTSRAKIREILQHKRIVFVIDNFHFRDIEILKYLITLCQIVYGKVSFISVGLSSDFEEKHQNFDDFGVFYENVLRFSYLAENEFVEWLEINYPKKFNTFEIGEIYKFSGGVIGLAKEMISRNITKYDETLEDYVLESWERFSRKEKKIIKALVQREIPPPYHKELNYLAQQGLIQNDEIKGEWFHQVIGNENIVRLDIRENEVFWDDLNISSRLSKRDSIIFTAIIKSHDHRLKRDDIANLLWGEESTEKYSNWAIDKSIERLRKSLQSIGLRGIVVTEKYIGIRLSESVLVNRG